MGTPPEPPALQIVEEAAPPAYNPPEQVAPGDAPTEEGTGTPALEMPEDTVPTTQGEQGGQGTLRIQAFRGQQVIPLPGVYVKVVRSGPEGETVFFEGVTNESGIIDPIVLPVTGSGNGYELAASAPGYVSIRQEVEIFPGIKTVQPLQMKLAEE